MIIPWLILWACYSMPDVVVGWNFWFVSLIVSIAFL